MADYIFPDVERAVADLLGSLVTDPADHSGTEAPIDIANSLPYIVVSRSGGPDINGQDHPVLEVDVYGPTRAIAYPLAEQCRQLLLRGPHVVTDGGFVAVIDSVLTLVGPRRLPSGNDNLRRFGASYEAVLRPQLLTS